MTDKDKMQFEQWYVENAFDYPSNPVGSRDCGLQRKAWQAAKESDRKELEELRANIILLKIKLVSVGVSVCPHCMGMSGILIEGEKCLACASTGYMEAIK